MKYLIKRIILFTVAVLIVVTIAACSNKNNTPDSTPGASPTPTATPTPTPTATPTPTPTPVVVPDGALISYVYHTIQKVSDEPLFKANGSVNTDVLESLLEILSNKQLDPAARAVTAEDFSGYAVPASSDISTSGAIVIKLFETIPEKEGVHNMHLTEFTRQWWQLVYRTADDGNDVLTLWMMQPYRVTPFNGTRYDNRVGNTSDRFTDRMRASGDSTWSRILNNSINTVFSDEIISLGLPPCSDYFFEGNYSVSIARDNLLRDADAVLDRFKVSSYLVSPSDLPGSWQSAAFQTGTNINNEFYISGEFYLSSRNFTGSDNEIDGTGATGLIWGERSTFALNNGMDGLSVGPFSGNWPNTTLVSTYEDMFWLPSDFETRTMGYDKETARSTTLLDDANNRSTSLRFSDDIETEDTDETDEGEESNERPDTGRTGLWRLNGFDRAFDRNGLNLPRGWMTEQVWLRSCDSLGIGNGNMITNRGSRQGYGVHQLAGMRPAVHLSISELKELIGG